jgi:ribosomal protein S4
LRQSWNKYNLYNLWRQRNPTIGFHDHETFFQQKWRSKGLLRAYHGEHIKEREWERMFSRRLLSVANLEPRYMAEFDGSEKAAGRGSGQDSILPWQENPIPPSKTTPYMNMAFAPMERRLDIAVFRAMFASSARQARQFCVHGAVKVNGKKVWCFRPPLAENKETDRNRNNRCPTLPTS